MTDTTRAGALGVAFWNVQTPPHSPKKENRFCTTPSRPHVLGLGLAEWAVRSAEQPKVDAGAMDGVTAKTELARLGLPAKKL